LAFFSIIHQAILWVDETMCQGMALEGEKKSILQRWRVDFIGFMGVKLATLWIWTRPVVSYAKLLNPKVYGEYHGQRTAM
jgi:hypothetical protein